MLSINVCVSPSLRFPSDSVSAGPSPPPAPALPPGRWGPAGGLPAGRCWRTGSPGRDERKQRSNVENRVDLNARLKHSCGRLAAPLNPCEPGLVCRRPSCCWAPAAAQSRSPLWPPQNDSASGSRWPWMAAKTLNFRQSCKYLVSERYCL